MAGYDHTDVADESIDMSVHETSPQLRAQPTDATTTTTTRTDPAAQSHSYNEGTEELTCITLPSLQSPQASHPVSPGSSSTIPLQDESPRAADFAPPVRPSSTPFPHPERRNSSCCPDGLPGAGDPDGASQSAALGADDDSEHTFSEATMPTAPSPSLSGYEADAAPASKAMNLDSLPAEIHEAILDHLFGYRVSAASKSSVDMHCVTRSWGTVLRHSRRKELSRLALVNATWRCLIQQRLYRHIKVRATVESIEQATAFFLEHPHLTEHVMHMELWFPVFQRGPPVPASPWEVPSQTDAGPTSVPSVTPTYTLPMGKVSLEEAFAFVRRQLPSVRVLTLEGGERRKAPKVDHFVDDGLTVLPSVTSVQTLVVKGQWNLMRESADFHAILNALPNVAEWHGSYSRPKSKTYLSIAKVLPSLPLHVTRLHLCLEGEYRRELVCPPFFRKVTDEIHFCTSLAAAVPALEQFSYTGRLCKTFFDALAHKVDPRTSRLRSINITARNVCRPYTGGTGCGIQDLGFMSVFEQLTVAGIRALSALQALEYLRIRYIDLDSPVPPLNPFFLMKDGWVSGLWSDDVLAELARSRPSLRYDAVREDFGEITVNKEGRIVISPYYPRPRVLGLKLSNYAYLSEGVTMGH